jgi:acetolactate synthase small subunit
MKKEWVKVSCTVYNKHGVILKVSGKVHPDHLMISSIFIEDTDSSTFDAWMEDFLSLCWKGVAIQL